MQAHDNKPAERTNPVRREVAARHIEMKTVEQDGETLVIEGELRDDRFMDFTGFEGATIPAGRFHTIRARLTVAVATMRIEDIDVEFQDVPHDECRELREKYRSLIGLSIASGFTRSVLARVGGTKGCAHLTHLIITMGPAFVQAAFTYQTRAEAPTPPTPEQVRKYFTDSCFVWRADGRYARKYGAE
jgi:hypothetical protein